MPGGMTDVAAVNEFLAANRERIDAYLDRQLPPDSEPPRRLHRIMRYAVFSGGKRLRPALAAASAAAAGADPERALPVAAAAELVHAASLVFDDLPIADNSAVRRGRPATHVDRDPATVILAGVALVCEGFEQCTRLPNPAAGAAAAARLNRVIGSEGMISGQLADLGIGRCRTAPEGSEIEIVHLQKTASLFRFSAWSGGLAAGLDGAALDRLDAFGRAYGLAFQSVDDMLDQDPHQCSILRVASREEARDRVHQLLGRAASHLDGFGGADGILGGLLRALEARLESRT